MFSTLISAFHFLECVCKTYTANQKWFMLDIVNGTFTRLLRLCQGYKTFENTFNYTPGQTEHHYQFQLSVSVHSSTLSYGIEKTESDLPRAKCNLLCSKIQKTRAVQPFDDNCTFGPILLRTDSPSFFFENRRSNDCSLVHAYFILLNISR